MKTHSNSTLALLLCVSVGALLPTEAMAAFGDLYQVAPFNGFIYKYTPAGAQSTFTSGLASTPNHIAFNSAGDLFVNEGSGATAKVTRITPAGVKTPFITGVEANGLTFDDAGNLFVSDSITQSILKITPAGVKSTFAAGVNTSDLVWGHGFDGPVLFATDFGAAPSNPSGPGIDGQGKVYRFAQDGTKSTFVGNLNRPKRLATDGGNLFVATSDGIIFEYNFYFGDPYDKTFATGLGNIQGMACDPAGNLLVSTSTAIVKFTFPGKVKTTFAPASNPSGLAYEKPRDLALNISTRLSVQQGDNALIAGFIITGPDHKSILVRGMGPSLGALGVPNALQNPTIEMHFPTGVVISNDNWKDGNAAASIQGTAFAPKDDRESALAFNIPPGNYSVIERGVDNTTGVGIVEVYDTQQTANSRLANISTRGFVSGGDNVMIGGFILGGGNGAGKVLIRGIGPSLSAAGISNPLANPTVELRNANGATLVSNNDWQETIGSEEVEETGLQPSNELESAFIAILPAGNYTAIVAGKDGGTGIGLVEVYSLR